MCSYSFWCSSFLCIDLDFHLVRFLSPWRISFNIFCGLNLLMVNSSSFCMPEKNLYFTFVFERFLPSVEILGWQVFSFQYLKDGVHCLSSMFSDEKSFILSFVILYITGLLFSHSFSDFSLYYGFWVIWFIICVIVIFFIYLVTNLFSFWCIFSFSFAQMIRYMYTFSYIIFSFTEG